MQRLCARRSIGAGTAAGSTGAGTAAGSGGVGAGTVDDVDATLAFAFSSQTEAMIVSFAVLSVFIGTFSSQLHFELPSALRGRCHPYCQKRLGHLMLPRYLQRLHLP